MGNRCSALLVLKFLYKLLSQNGHDDAFIAFECIKMLINKFMILLVATKISHLI